MNDPKSAKPDVPPTPERDTSRKGREEEVLNQQEGNTIINSDAGAIVNGATTADEITGEQQFKEGTFDHTVKLDEVEKENMLGSDQTGSEESGVPGSGI